MYAYLVRSHWTTYKCNLHEREQYVSEYTTRIRFLFRCTGLMTQSWAAIAAVTNCSSSRFCSCTSYSVLLRDSVWTWTSATIITANKKQREQRRSNMKWEKRSKKRRRIMLISQEKRTSEKRRQTEKRTKIKCHNNMSGDRAFTNLSRSFNLFDENHLFFLFSCSVSVSHLSIHSSRKGHHH